METFGTGGTVVGPALDSGALDAPVGSQPRSESFGIGGAGAPDAPVGSQPRSEAPVLLPQTPAVRVPGTGTGVGAGVDTGAGVGSGTDTGVGTGTGVGTPARQPDDRGTEAGVRTDLGPGTGTIFGTDQGVAGPGTQPAPGAPPTEARPPVDQQLPFFGGGAPPQFGLPAPQGYPDSPGGVDHQSQPGGVDWGDTGFQQAPERDEDDEASWERRDGIGQTGQSFDERDGVGTR